MKRRTLLATTGPALCLPVGGCLRGLGDSGSPDGTADLPVRVWFEETSLSASQRDSIDPIVFADLSKDEQEIVTTALEEGEYTVDTESAPPAVEALRTRIEERADGELEVYLRRGETYYRVGFADGDHIIAHPTQ